MDEINKAYEMGDLETKEDYARREKELAMEKTYFCGSCNLGFNDLPIYEEHCELEEHNFHIQRKIDMLVPGLGFCPACSGIHLTTTSWISHLGSDKHAKCKASLIALKIEGDFDTLLGCSEPGVLGGPMPATSLDQQAAKKYGFGHGGKMKKGEPLVGLGYIKQVTDNRYLCNLCSDDFTFEFRTKHLTSHDHRLNYLKKYYMAWYEEALQLAPDYPIQLSQRLLFRAHQAQLVEQPTEDVEIEQLRKKFTTESTQKKPTNIEKRKQEAAAFAKGSGWRGSNRGGWRGRGSYRGKKSNRGRGGGGGSVNDRGHEGFVASDVGQPFTFGYSGPVRAPGARYNVRRDPLPRARVPQTRPPFREQERSYSRRSTSAPFTDPYAEAAPIDQLTNWGYDNEEHDKYDGDFASEATGWQARQPSYEGYQGYGYPNHHPGSGMQDYSYPRAAPPPRRTTARPPPYARHPPRAPYPPRGGYSGFRAGPVRF